MSKEEKNQRADELIRYLTSRFIPFHPPLTGKSLENLKKTNLEGYNNLMEYLALEDELKDAQ